MLENRPRHSADASLLKCGMERDAIHGPQSGSGELREESTCTEQCQSSVATGVLPMDSLNTVIN